MTSEPDGAEEVKAEQEKTEPERIEDSKDYRDAVKAVASRFEIK